MDEATRVAERMTDPEASALKVANLVNLYPKISHSFIRREIQALESHGVVVRRYAIRRTSEPLVDDADREELAKTERLAEAMKLALSTADSELTSMGGRARERVLRMHDVRREAAKLKGLFARYAR